jgi:hypothetical protein
LIFVRGSKSLLFLPFCNCFSPQTKNWDCREAPYCSREPAYKTYFENRESHRELQYICAIYSKSLDLHSGRYNIEGSLSQHSTLPASKASFALFQQDRHISMSPPSLHSERYRRGRDFTAATHLKVTDAKETYKSVAGAQARVVYIQYPRWAPISLT